MRNPAPLVLSLLLGIAALVLIVRQPDPPAAEAAPDEPAETSATAATPTPPPAAETDLAAVEPRPWPQQDSDIPADPDARFGALPNGFRYLIYPNAEPPGRVSLRLHIDAGSLMEADDQQGLAHFLEHMVFNGTKHFTPAELVPRMQRLGIAFGAHANAYTSFDETVYMLDLPNLDEATLDLCFQVMRDFGDGALLKADEIDKERGVILSEMRSRDSVNYRLMKEQFRTLIPDSLITRRFPIGEQEVIESAPRERFADFYRDYYTPRRMTFVVVGDVRPEDMIARIEASFATLANPDEPGADPQLGAIPPAGELAGHVFTDPELAGTELSLMQFDAFEPRADTSGLRRERIRLELAHTMLATRFDRLARAEGSPILGGAGYREELFNHLVLGGVDVEAAEGRWQDAVAVLEQEFRRALEHGFTTAEYAEARANLLNAAEQAVKGRDSRRSDMLATGLVRSINGNSVFASPETNLEIIRGVVEESGPADCHAALVSFWDGHPGTLTLTAKEAPEDAAEQLLARYRASREQAVEAPEEAEVKSFAYSDFGAAGELVSEETLDDLGITRLAFANGVTVNLKPTDFEKNRIRLEARIGHGQLTQPADQPGLAEFATAVVENGGIGEHSAEELQRIFAGRNVAFGFSVDEDHFSLAGFTTPDDLGLQLQAMAAQILHPGYREEAVAQFRKGIPMLFQQLRHTAAGPMQEMRGWLRGDDPRFRFPREADTLLAYTLDDLKPWLEPAFSSAPIELSLVGDFDPALARPLIAASFGALEPRQAEPLPEGARTVTVPAAPLRKEFDYRSEIPQAQALVFWKTPGIRGNEELFRRLQFLAAILDDRLREKIREELGVAYSPGATVDGSNALEDYGFVLAYNMGKPEDVDTLLEATLELAADLAAEGASEDEFERAREPILTEVEKSTRDNGYWLNSVLSGSTDQPRRFDLARNRGEDLAGIGLDEINQLAAQYLGDARALQVVIRAQAPDAAPANDAAAEPEE